jgi:hypothetical protein
MRVLAQTGFVFRNKRDPSRAKENLYKAIEIFKECKPDGWVERYEKKRTHIYKKLYS